MSVPRWAMFVKTIQLRSCHSCEPHLGCGVGWEPQSFRVAPFTWLTLPKYGHQSVTRTPPSPLMGNLSASIPTRQPHCPSKRHAPPAAGTKRSEHQEEAGSGQAAWLHREVSADSGTACCSPKRCRRRGSEPPRCRTRRDRRPGWAAKDCGRSRSSSRTWVARAWGNARQR